jgi:hypothetical protein
MVCQRQCPSHHGVLKFVKEHADGRRLLFLLPEWFGSCRCKFLNRSAMESMLARVI